MARLDEPSEADSGAASDRARYLDRVFGADGWTLLQSSVRERELFHSRAAGAQFAALFAWDDLSRLLERTPLAPPRIALVRGGKPISEAAYLQSREGVERLDAGALTRQLDEGATLIVNFLDEMSGRVAELCDALADELEVRTSANLYASWRAEHGLPLHWDRHGVLVLQLAGRKRWTVHGRTRRDPLQGDAFVAPPTGAAPVWEEVLGEGDWLYLPRGYPHVASAIDGPSLHLSVALIQPTAYGYLRWLVEELREDPLWRGDVPASGDDEPAFLAELRAGLAAAVTPASLAGYRSMRTAEKITRPQFAFPELERTAPVDWNAGTALRLASRRALAFYERGLRLGGSALGCTPEVARALARLSGGRSVSLGDLEGGLDPPSRAELRRLLGVLHLRGALASTPGGVSQPHQNP